METIAQDVRYAWRTFRKSPGFAAAVILTLALGIGANTAAFGLLRALVLRPMPVAEPDRMVVLFGGFRGSGAPTMRLSYPNFADVRDGARTLESMAAYCWPIGLDVQRGFGGAPEPAFAQLVSGTFFETLGVRAALGRTFAPDEDRTRNTHPVAVVSHRFWRGRLNGDPKVVGTTLRLNGRAFTVIGVAPERMPQVDPPFAPDLWVPMAVQALVMPGQEGRLDQRRNKWLRAIGRMRSDATVAQAHAELDGLARQLEQAYPADNARLTLTAIPELDARTRTLGRSARLTWGLTALVAAVLLIACANVANLLVVRAFARAREMSVRASLGAGRARLLRQLLTEHLLLALAGGIAGAVLASLVAGQVWTLLLPPTRLPIWIDASNSRVLLLSASACTLLTMALFGVLPAWRATRGDVVAGLKAGGSGGATASGTGRAGRSVAQDALVVTQLALCVIVLAAAALFLRSLTAALRIELGFTPAERIITTVDLGRQGYDAARARQFHDALLARVRALPGVQAASTTGFPPLGGGYLGDTTIVPDGQTVASEEHQRPLVIYDRVGPDYFRAMGTPILRGRDLADADATATPTAAVVNAAFARTFWPNDTPIGKRFRIVRPVVPVVEVVGLVSDGQYETLGERPQRRMFLPFQQSRLLGFTLVVHARGASLSAIVPEIRRAVRDIDPAVPAETQTLASHVELSVAQPRVFAWFASGVGVLALLLAVMGVYGTLSFLVRGRTREIGVRLAVGARPAQVLWLVMRRGAALAACGLALGSVAAVLVSRLLATMLFGATTLDVRTAVVVAAVLAAAVLIASVVPARRAARTNLVQALRAE